MTKEEFKEKYDNEVKEIIHSITLDSSFSVSYNGLCEEKNMFDKIIKLSLTDKEINVNNVLEDFNNFLVCSALEMLKSSIDNKIKNYEANISNASLLDDIRSEAILKFIP